MTPRLVAFLLLLVSFACAPIRFDEQEVFVTHDAKADELRLALVYDSIQIAPQRDHHGLEEGRRFAKSVTDGRREFIILGWPLCFDLESHFENESEDETESTVPDDEREWFELAKEVRVITAGYCCGTQDRLSLYQELEFPHASRWIAKLERFLLEQIEKLADSGELDQSTTWLDTRSRELWIEMAREKRSWLSLKDGVLTMDLPVTSACAASWIARVERQQAEDASLAAPLGELFSHLSELRIADEHLVLRWKLDGPSWVFRTGTEAHDPRLAESLRDSKSLPAELRSREEVSAAWRKR